MISNCGSPLLVSPVPKRAGGGGARASARRPIQPFPCRPSRRTKSRSSSLRSGLTRLANTSSPQVSPLTLDPNSQCRKHDPVDAENGRLPCADRAQVAGHWGKPGQSNIVWACAPFHRDIWGRSARAEHPIERGPSSGSSPILVPIGLGRSGRVSRLTSTGRISRPDRPCRCGR